jgi:Tol biopolymer transport system component
MRFPNLPLLFLLFGISVQAAPPQLFVDASRAPAVTVGGCQVKQVALSGGKQRNVELFILNNGRLEIATVPTRGMSILYVKRRGDDGHWSTVLGWNSPVKQVVHPQYINLDARGGLGWLDGFNEWMVRCGLEFAGHPGQDVFIDNTGARAEMNLTLHGKIGNIPALQWNAVAVGNRTVIRGVVYEEMFFGPKFQLVTELSTEPNSDSFQIRDIVVNEGSAPQEMMLLYHCNFGAPLLEAGAKVVIAAESVKPMNTHAAQALASYDTYQGPTAGFIEEVFLVQPRSNELGQTTALLKNSTGTLGCSLNWSTRQLPYLTIWKNTVDERDGYVTGLEPGTCYPYNRRHEREQGRLLKLVPNEPYEFAIDVQIHPTAAAVAEAEARVQALQGAEPIRLIAEPEMVQEAEPVAMQAPATPAPAPVASPAPQAQPKRAEPPASIEGQFLKNIRQVTRWFPRAGEGYFSPDDQQIVYQAFPPGYPFYQIYVQDLAGGEPRRLSPGRGRTTCAYFSRDGQQILFSSSHTDPQIEETELAARRLAAEGGRRRYEWDFDPHMEIYVCNTDGSQLRRLTDSPGYDAEASYSHDGRHIVFTSSRDGDPDLYIMDADGTNVRQLTNVDGYDGGPFFSPDDQWIIFRSDRDQEHMLQLYAISVDGTREVQLTDDLNTVNWAPYFHPGGRFLIWTRADYSRGPQAANFDLYTMELDWTDGLHGGKVTRITDHPKADVLPVFSNSGRQLMWTSSRGEDGSSQLWIADWLPE